MPTVSDYNMAVWWAEDLLERGWSIQDVRDMTDAWVQLMHEIRNIPPRGG